MIWNSFSFHFIKKKKTSQHFRNLGVYILPYAQVDMISIYIYIFFCENFKYVIKYLHISRGYYLIGTICGTLNRAVYVIYYISVWERTETDRKKELTSQQLNSRDVWYTLTFSVLSSTLLYTEFNSFPQQKHNKKTSLIQIYKIPTQRTETHFSRRTMHLCVHIITVIITITTLPYKHICMVFEIQCNSTVFNMSLFTKKRQILKAFLHMRSDSLHINDRWTSGKSSTNKTASVYFFRPQ